MILRLESLIQIKETVDTKITKVNELNKIELQDKTKLPLIKIDLMKRINAVKLTIDLPKTIVVKDNNPTKANEQEMITMFINLELARDVEEISQGRNIIIVNTKTNDLTEVKELHLEAALYKISIMKSMRKMDL